MDVDFGEAIDRCLKRIPRGRVATCGVVARALGDERAARAVATWLTGHPDSPRAHRVVRADGRPVLQESGHPLSREGVRLLRGRVPARRIVDSLPPVRFLERLREEQERIATMVVERDEPGPIDIIAGVDVSYSEDHFVAAAASIDAERLEVVEIGVYRGRADFPYIPTYLAYRELPGIQAAVLRLSKRPDVLMVDGHGRLHPALAGIACMAGVALDLPSIGIAKHRLVGGRVRDTSEGDRAPLPIWIGDSVRGYAWNPTGRSTPIYVSVGHRISLERAMTITRRTTRRGYPEALRIADRASREMKRNEKREKGARR